MGSFLLQFPPPPRRSNATVFEQEGQMKDVPETVPLARLPNYPDVVVHKEGSSRTNMRYNNAQLAFLPSGQTSWKKSLHAWYEGGFVSMLEELANAENEAPSWLAKICETSMSFIEKLSSVKETLFPQILVSDDDLIAKYTRVANWHKSLIRALAWHPHVTKLAVAFWDDSIQVYYSGGSLCPILKHKLQKQVADLAWKPLSSSILAVACRTCILIWHVEPTSLAVRPSSSTVQILHCSGHSPVTSLAWSPDSDHLVSASPKHTSVIVWDVPRERKVALRRDRGGGLALLSYSPDGSKLFTATLSPLFRVWETKSWHWEVWSQLGAHCKAACWSPDGTVLVFAVEGESALYAVRFTEGVGEDSGCLSAASTSVMLVDLSPVVISVGPVEDIRVGGEIKSIVWDDSGERLAILFEPNELGNNMLVAVFKSTIHPVLELLPGGFIKGGAGESAHHIAFQPNFPKGALLSVVWSSGRVGYIPMYFVPAEDIEQSRISRLETWSASAVKSPRERF